MSTQADNMELASVGERLRVVREGAKITQANAAAAAGIARTTLVAIEQGQRRVRVEELQQLARLYGVSVNALVRQEAVFTDLIPRFRKLPNSSESAIEQAARLLNDLVRAEVELENLLGVRRPRNYPQQRPILVGDVRVQAEQDAAELRQWLGLGQAPVSDVFALLEFQLGVRVYVRRLPQRVSGLFAFDEVAGACMLINANHPRSRRCQTAAHELGHLVSTRSEPDFLCDDSPEQSREERYAHAFARNFLLPARTLLQSFADVTAGASHLNRRHIIVLAHSFGVSREALVKRLEEVGRAKSGTWDWFTANGGITDEQEKQVLGDLVTLDSAKVDADRPVSLRLGLLAAEAWRKELLSEGQLARLLRLDRIETRTLLDSFEAEGSEHSEVTALS